jgi:hypothetical protein
MHRWFAHILLACLLLSACQEGVRSCKEEKVANEHYSLQTFTFQVNKHLPLYECKVTISEPDNGYDFGRIAKIEITETDNDLPIQTIILPNEENDFYYTFLKSAAYFIDVTFDGNLDLLVPRERSARYISFSAFLWDNKIKQFIETPSFETVYNPSIDSVRKRILSTASGDKSTIYNMFEYKNNDFILMNSFGWIPADLAVDKIPNTEDLIHCTESRWHDGCFVSVNCFYVPNFYGIAPKLEPYDDVDPQLKPYIEPGSFWDLSSSKWRSTFADELR